jgi:hypothetical protein
MMADLGTGTPALLAALAPDVVPARTERARTKQLADAVGAPTNSQAWLILTVIGRRLPLAADVLAFARLSRENGLQSSIATVRRARRSINRLGDLPVHIVTEAVLLDVHNSATRALLTGVQRVSRSLADAFAPKGATLIGWSSNRTQLLPLRADAWAQRGTGRIFQSRALVPFGGHYVLPEVVTDVDRTQRILALAEHSRARTMLIGDDAIPLTTAETTGPGMPGAFAKYLAAASRMSVVACISGAASIEYSGWKAMLPSAGLAGPEIVTVMLAETAETPDPAMRSRAEQRFLRTDASGPLPMVLCVGSHEPRKNHDAVLHAAELLWREGHRFSLMFVGGNSWNSEEFRMRLGELRAQGRPAEALRGVPDSELWWAYSLARFTVFPSLNEGFGLPVTESLLSGTPVVASNFGSLAEIAAGGGCLLVDPRDDAAVAAGMAQLLTDDVLYERLAAEAANRAPRSWEQYADDVWHVLID